MYEGCYNEETSSDNQDLSEWPLVDGAAMTVDACAAHCRDHGYKYCGITVSFLSYRIGGGLITGE